MKKVSQPRKTFFICGRQGCDSPKMSLYKEVLTRKAVTPTTPPARRSQSRSPVPGPPSAGGSSGSPGRARYVPPASNSPLAKFLRHSPLSDERYARAPWSPPPEGDHVPTPPAPLATFVVAADVPRPPASAVVGREDHRGRGANPHPHPASHTGSVSAEADRKRKQQVDVDAKEPGSAKRLHNGEKAEGGQPATGLSDQAVYRQLYASVMASPASASSNIETLRCFLEDQMGAAKFTAIHANMTVAVKNRLSFDGLSGFIRDGDLWLLFPLLIQLVQLESVVNTANQSCA